MTFIGFLSGRLFISPVLLSVRSLYLGKHSEAQRPEGLFCFCSSLENIKLSLSSLLFSFQPSFPISRQAIKLFSFCLHCSFIHRRIWPSACITNISVQSWGTPELFLKAVKLRLYKVSERHIQFCKAYLFRGIPLWLPKPSWMRAPDCDLWKETGRSKQTILNPGLLPEGASESFITTGYKFRRNAIILSLIFLTLILQTS